MTPLKCARQWIEQTGPRMLATDVVGGEMERTRTGNEER